MVDTLSADKSFVDNFSIDKFSSDRFLEKTYPTFQELISHSSFIRQMSHQEAEKECFAARSQVAGMEFDGPISLHGVICPSNTGNFFPNPASFKVKMMKTGTGMEETVKFDGCARFEIPTLTGGAARFRRKWQKFLRAATCTDYTAAGCRS